MRLRGLPLTGLQVQLYVWEDCPEGLARHLLQAAVALDAGLPPRQRAETLLELHGNALLRDTTASYLGEDAQRSAAQRTAAQARAGLHARACSRTHRQRPACACALRVQRRAGTHAVAGGTQVPGHLL